MKSDKNPIGIFDSGVGGLSIWIKLIGLLKNESFIYYGDSANCPYGVKSPGEIIKLSDNITKFLISKDCKLIVVACNTATAGAIDYLRENYDVPFIGIEPAIKPAALNSITKRIGVLATDGTFNGRLFNETKGKYTNNIDVFIQPGHGLVELVESGEYDSDKALNLLKKYITPMLENNVDQIVLGCTHYPFLSPLIEKITKNRSTIIDPAEAVAKQTKNQLELHNLSNNEDNVPFYKFYTTGGVQTLTNLIKKISKVEFEINTI
jgi:glutamate racemase